MWLEVVSCEFVTFAGIIIIIILGTKPQAWNSKKSVYDDDDCTGRRGT